MAFIKFVLRIPLRMTDEQCMVGDFAVHEEESYTFAYFNRALISAAGSGKSGDEESGVVLEGIAPPEKPSSVPAKFARHVQGTSSTEHPTTAHEGISSSSSAEAPGTQQEIAGSNSAAPFATKTEV